MIGIFAVAAVASERYERLEPAPAWHQDVEGDCFWKQLLSLRNSFRP